MDKLFAEEMGSTPKGERTCVSKYLLFRCLERAIPEYIGKLFEFYSLEYVEGFIQDHDMALNCKEEIDDYLADVNYRVIDRLDQVNEAKKLQTYFQMDIGLLIDKMNSLAVADKVVMIINKTKYGN